MFATERIRGICKQDGVTVNNFIRRSYLNAIEEKLASYKESGEPQLDSSGKYLYFFQNPETKIILAFIEEPLYRNDPWGNSPYHRIVYAFMSSTGKVLPNPE